MLERRTETDVARGVKSQAGFSLIEVLMVAAIMGVMALMMVTMQTNQLKANAFLEFQLKRDQLKAATIGQFLNNADNCKCLFQNHGAQPFPNSGIDKLVTSTPITEIGRFSYPTPGDCTGASILSPFVSGAFSNGLRTTGIELTDITAPISNVYSAKLKINLQSQKEMVGPKEISVVIDNVAVTTLPSGSDQVFQSCSFGSASSGSTSGPPHCRLVLETWANDNCTGSYAQRFSDYFDAVAPGSGPSWTARNASGGLESSYAGRNRAGGDIACMRIGFECR